MQMNECKFFHYAPNDDKFYHITSQIILQGSVSSDDHNYDHGFFYNINPTTNYYVSCKILPHSLIINILNKKIYGIDIAMNNLEREESLSLNQKLDLEQDLKQVLPFHLTHYQFLNSREIKMNSDRNLNPSYGDNTQTISLTDSQTNFENGFPQQTRVINPQQEVFNNIPQQIPEGLRCNGNINPFHGNVGNNVMVTQGASIANSQNNDFLQPINPPSTSAAPQNRIAYDVINSQQQIGSNNIPQHIADRDMRSNYHGNINQNNGNDSQNVNGARNFTYTQQQIDINNYYGNSDLHNGNSENNVMTTQANDLTCDHQNDIQQVDLNNNYGYTDLQNENIGNNIRTTQANGLTRDYQDINDIHQFKHINDNYEDTDPHNSNIGNDLTTTQINSPSYSTTATS
ncbi:uncharacterized protein OCT59_010651 [Rhizophagus irregularis]|uniref:Uncharacterized protein n=2 Tax=Rhizophagus irregularis TaxID=588596 RepID=A0A015K6E6_RHIIW|nr:hypothetical protein GLOIN_2v1847910 [Rhizophagus irregularis DAOM 181602=DAOM 197198]EXX77342.1 hypothetical protein RirG_024640 [Rhizophagus irregularis DAOM 197198w]POG59864.1 hypothetical protein GLOIN_2v1847910 [Rhizophagus irregularis DAOM 181602=DAOM 197198]UZO19354.1 hypothetical protein OCT59_010651 [Rhizophagus irregularis]GBC13220.2 hypothetical protein GLOIN_2v1847910 [Rhizophagus irregularis DAOM 181602=DAOM 197198]|eukprot:XP_025166730.1 hypothetical protein GLOIN_2v1847910 [Rhizophagus irregularis DAOM 181602=DAOM 197198]